MIRAAWLNTSSSDAPVSRRFFGWKSLRDVVAMPTGKRALVEVLADVLGEVSRCPTRLVLRRRPDRHVSRVVDPHEAPAPRILDPSARHIAPNGEMGVQAVRSLMPLGNPDVRERLTNPTTQTTEERAKVGSKLRRVVAPGSA